MVVSLTKDRPYSLLVKRDALLFSNVLVSHFLLVFILSFADFFEFLAAFLTDPHTYVEPVC